jgi:hypothetical protein
MAKLRREEGQNVSLFPFLSILACVIGVLTLLITSMALSQMNTKSEDEKVRRAEDYVALRKRLPKARTRADELRRLIAAAREVRQDLDRLRAERDRLKKMLSGDDTDRASLIAQLKAEIQRLQARIKELQDEIEERQELMKPLQEELASRQEAPESTVVIQPSGSGRASSIDPTFVETNATGLAVYQDKKIHRIPRGDIPKDPTFEKLCQQVAASQKGIVIFLIRSDGYGTYSHANNVARSRGARTGKLPVVGQGHIDLRLFKKEG